MCASPARWREPQRPNETIHRIVTVMTSRLTTLSCQISEVKAREKAESAAKKEGAEKAEKAEKKGVGGEAEDKRADGQPLTINDGGENAGSERDVGADREKPAEVAPYLNPLEPWNPKPETRNR